MYLTEKLLRSISTCGRKASLSLALGRAAIFFGWGFFGFHIGNIGYHATQKKSLLRKRVGSNAQSEVGEAPYAGVPRGAMSRYVKLRPGPGQPAEKVAADQRSRIHAAMLELVSEHGYEAVKLRGLAQRAQISTRTFYTHFSSKLDCFLVTYEQLIRCCVQRIISVQRKGFGWRERLRLSMDVLTDELARDPRAAHLMLVDIFSVWPESRGQVEHTAGLLEALVLDGLEGGPDGGVPTSRLQAKGIVAGVACAARAQLLAEPEERTPNLAEELTEWACPLLEGNAEELEHIYDPALSSRRAGPLTIGSRTPPGRRRAGKGDRALILSAAAKLGAGQGYSALTVPRIRRAAGVSRASFDAHFEDVCDCFLAALESHAGNAFAAALSESAKEGSWSARVRSVLTQLCWLLAVNPSLAKLAFVEVVAPGPAGVRCSTRMIADIARGLRAAAPAVDRPGQVAAEASVGAAWGIVHEQIGAGRARRLPRLAGALAFLVLGPALGNRAGAQAICVENGPGKRGHAEENQHVPTG